MFTYTKEIPLDQVTQPTEIKQSDVVIPVNSSETPFTYGKEIFPPEVTE